VVKERNKRTYLIFLKLREDWKRKGVLPSEGRDVKLGKLVMKFIKQREVSEIEIESVTPKAARGLLREKTGAFKTIDNARENSLRFKYQLYRLMVDMEKGDASRTLFVNIDQEILKQVAEWNSSAWKAVSTEDIPTVWKQ
jgi:hypothetical protein